MIKKKINKYYIWLEELSALLYNNKIEILFW